MRQLLACPGIEVNKSNGLWTPIEKAVGEGKGNLVAELLAHPDIKVNIKTYFCKTLIDYAVQSGRVDIVKQLLDHPGINGGSVKKAVKKLISAKPTKTNDKMLKLFQDYLFQHVPQQQEEAHQQSG